MLSPEQAKTALKKFEAADPKQQISQAAFALGFKRLQRIALGLRGFWLTGDNLSADDQKKVFETAFGQFAALPEDERARVFEAVFPSVSAHVEAAWRMAERVPYKLFDYNRQAFRAPGHPEAANKVRNRLLRGLLRVTPKYPQDIAWYAQYASYVSSYHGDYFGLLLAAAIDAGGEQSEAIFQTLRQTATGEHPIGVFGRHVSRGLLMASRPDGWELMEGMIVAAQRQEGLRQVVLETIDEAHPEAFRRMLQTILRHDITRFSACIRAVDAWLAFEWTAMDAKFAAIGLRRLLGFMENRAALEDALGDTPGEELYMALHALAMQDAPQAIVRAQAISANLAEPIDRRYVAARLLRLAELPGATTALVPLVSDPDLRVAGEALIGLSANGAGLGDSDLFERLERQLGTLKQPSQTLDAIVWPWNSVTVSREAIADKLVHFLGQRSPLLLLPYLRVMSGGGRLSVIHLLAKDNSLPATSREALFALVADPSSYVRETAFKALEKCRLEPDEARQIESLLTRKSSDSRRAALTASLRQDDAAALASAERLASSAKPEQRAGGVEILAQLHAAGRSKQECRSRAKAFRPIFTKRGDDAALSALDKAIPENEKEEARPATLDDALGLMNPEGRSKPTPPQMPRRFLIFSSPKTALASDASEKLLKSLHELIDRNSEITVEYESRWSSKQKELLGNIGWGFPAPWSGMPETMRMPLEPLWLEWERGRGAELRDPDGFEFYRTLVMPWKGIKVGDHNRSYLVRALLEWFVYLNHAPGEINFLLDALETACAADLENEKAKPDKPDEEVAQANPNIFRASSTPAQIWLARVREQRELRREDWSDEQMRRFWGLLRWVDEPLPKLPRRLPATDELIDAYEIGAATPDDIYDHLLGPANAGARYSNGFGTLRQLSTRKMGIALAKHPWLANYVERCRERIVELELHRGEMPGPAAQAAAALGYAGGMDALVALVAALGKSDLSRRGTSWYNAGHGRAETLSKLIKVTYPSEQDTPEAFAEAARAARLSEKLLVQTAIFAPQWSEQIEQALGWPGMSEGVWWLHAHTKSSEYGGPSEEWKAQVSRRTPLEAQDLLDGAVDVAWFYRIRDTIPAAQWKALDEAAKFTSSGTGHSRAKLFADAMLGNVGEAELIQRVESKRNQEALRALGLVPLSSSDDESQRSEVLRRYAVTQEFLRGSKKFGSMRQASEKQAAMIAMQNLARTAGYPDPVRLEWAMEQASVADLAGDGVVVERSAGDVTVQLAIDEFGEPALRAFKAGKPLKTIPPTAKKDVAIAELTRRKQEIVRQQSRMRSSLEAAMCRGDVFHAAELQELMDHPVLRPMLRSLVFVEAVAAGSADTKPLMGYPVDGGAALEDLAEIRPLPGDSRLRIAHPFDFFQSGQWDKWQWDCFTRERIQPFKQVFRELYLLTPGERENNKHSDRYAGHQVNLKQGLAILGKRGWIGSPMEGELARTFHAEGITVGIGFDAGYTTPAEVEGLTIDAIAFNRRGSYEPMPLDSVPPRVFSEAMRDIDLLVSVAHQGGVDPEASASTVEMRAALLRDACRLLKLSNVRFEPHHALIDGTLGKYTVHLGSGIVHRQPGGFLCIVPVHSQHRGRIFLPFADGDPRTAEVIAKVVLLAKDKEIKDPIILEQIYAGVAS